MTRDLIKAAKAVCDDAERGTKGVITLFGEPQSMIDAHLVVTLRAAVRAAEAAPVADEERVREAATKAVVYMQNGEDPSRDVARQRINAVADAIRHYIAPAPVADTVAVPVASLKQWLKRINLMPFRNELQPTIDEITALLPPPPAPEPSAELVAEWKREAKEYADKCCAEHESVTHDEYVGIQTGYVARARAEWVRTQKGGGS